ncbi:MAG: hypothetical protein A2166_00045 [Omnitrophica WOR_2 bacterium RBG_13_41_10]|nr:MAG: hypothetical protein A2166_00045 [Omnitrophica WOR_2 bacterium RBG_13_41_10]
MKTKDNYYHFLISLLIIFFNSMAYFLCLNSMKCWIPYTSLFVQLICQINMILNSLVFPFLLLLIIYFFRSVSLILILHFFVLIVLLTVSIYYKQFQSIPHINLIKHIYLLPPVIPQILFLLFGFNELIISASIVLSLAFSFRLSHDFKKNRFYAIPKKKILIFFLIIIIIAYPLKAILINSQRPITKWHRVHLLKLHGFIPVYFKQFREAIFKEKKIIPWPGKINLNTYNTTSRNKNEKNVIILQVETFDACLMDYQIGSEYVMPYMHSLKKQGMFFKYFFAYNRGGASSDAELGSLTSLIPLETHPGFDTVDYQKIIPLNRILAREGYYCVGIHANTGRYFNRIQSYALMGFDKFFDQEAFQGEAAGWDSKDKVFFEQTIKIIHSLPQPFFAYIITIQSHGPFCNYSTNPEIFDFSGLNKDMQDYMLTMHEVDQAISVFITQLEKYGFLKNTVVVIYGDFGNTVFYDDSPGALHYYGSHEDDLYRICPAGSRVPLLIIGPGISPSIKYKVGSHIDISPTILDLLGIAEPQGWLGSSLLQPGTGKAVLNYDELFVLVNQGNDVVVDDNYHNYSKFIDYSTSMLDP